MSIEINSNMPSVAPNEKENQVVQLDDSGDFKSIKIGSDISSSDVVRQDGDGGDVEIETDDIFIEDDIDKVIQRFRFVSTIQLVSYFSVDMSRIKSCSRFSLFDFSFF